MVIGKLCKNKISKIKIILRSENNWRMKIINDKYNIVCVKFHIVSMSCKYYECYCYVKWIIVRLKLCLLWNMNVKK